MQVQNSNLESETIYQRLLSISDDIITCSRTGRQYKLKGNLGAAYTLVFEECTTKPARSENMFNKYKEILTLHFVNYVKSANIQYDEYVFRQTNKFWSAYIKYATILARQVFSYLDRYFLPSRQHGNLIDVAVAIFDKNVFGNETKKQLYTNCFIESIRVMRKNLIITQNHIYDFFRQLFPINSELYFQMKKVYVEETRAFYQQKFRQIKELQPLYFYNTINNLIYFEETLSSVCLYWTAEEILKERILMPIIFTKELVQPYTPIFLNHEKGFLWALQVFHVPLLSLVTDIYSKFEGFQKVKKFYYDWVVEESRKLIQSLQKQDEGQVITIITKFFDKHQKILTVGFKKHQQIQVTLSNALQFGVGKWQKLPQILFKVCEKIVADGSFDLNSPTIKSVFQKIGNKDEFIHKCETWIQSVLLSQKISIKQLHDFANFLHELCGSENTNRLNKLVSDYIQENCQEKRQDDIFACKIISNHLWERRFKEEVAICFTLPQALDNIWGSYLSGYTSNNQKKSLQLMPLSSRIILNLRFKKPLTVKCNLLQASIIFSLEQSSKTQDELIRHVNTEKNLINSFVALAKFIITKDDKLAIDWGFQEEGIKDFTEQFEEKSKFIKAIEQDRNILLEAGIVRMIKRRKEASFEEIFDQLCHAIKLFKPQPHMVKSTIEKLIKRDFIESNEQGLYLYKQ